MWYYRCNIVYKQTYFSLCSSTTYGCHDVITKMFANSSIAAEFKTCNDDNKNGKCYEYQHKVSVYLFIFMYMHLLYPVYMYMYVCMITRPSFMLLLIQILQWLWPNAAIGSRCFFLSIIFDFFFTYDVCIVYSHYLFMNCRIMYIVVNITNNHDVLLKP